MQNSNLDLKKLKAMLRDPVIRTILISLSTVIITLGIVFAVAWHYRAQVFKILAINYPTELKPTNPTLVYDPKVEEPIKTDVAPAEIPVIVEEDSVVGAVKKAKPAVVSIIVSEMVTKYDVTYKENTSLGGLLPGFFQTPVYTPNGTEKKKVGSGSGFLISSSGLIVTNRHVVSKTDAVYEVLLNSGKTYTATVLARDTVLDVAIMKITATGLPYLELGDSDSLDVGQSVVAIGNALGEFKNTVSVGVVSGLSRSVTASDKTGKYELLHKVIQTDAAINPGNSGGPLLDLSGKVIGINVAVVEGSSNVGFALPINSVKGAINSVKSTGKIVQPYVGVRYIPVTSELKIKYNLPVDYGIWVQKGKTTADLAVTPDSPAEKAGILENDIILSVDGQKIDKDNDFSSLIREKQVGKTVALRIISNGIEKTVSVRLEAIPSN